MSPKWMSTTLRSTTFMLLAGVLTFSLVPGSFKPAVAADIPHLGFWTHWDKGTKKSCHLEIFNLLKRLQKTSHFKIRNWQDWREAGYKFQSERSFVKIACLTEKKSKNKSKVLISIAAATSDYPEMATLMNKLITRICGQNCKKFKIAKSKPAHRKPKPPKSKPSGKGKPSGSGGKCDNIGAPC